MVPATLRLPLQAVVLVVVVGVVPASAWDLRYFATDTQCPTRHLACSGVASGTRKCIMASDLCDGLRDCPDGSDEWYCPTCGGGAVYCKKEAKCVRAEWRCDGTRDCADGEDEADCPADGGTTFLGAHYDADMKYVCKSTVSTVTRWVFTLCDGENDCPDASDEEFSAPHCTARARKKVPHKGPVSECAPGSVACKASGRDTPQCLLVKRRCDGWMDCRGGEDEKDCEGVNATLATTTTRTTHTAAPGDGPSTPSSRSVCGTAGDDAVNGQGSARTDSATPADVLKAIQVALTCLGVACFGMLAFQAAAFFRTCPSRPRRRLRGDGEAIAYLEAPHHRLRDLDLDRCQPNQ